jgi:hypothetical protein
MEAQQNLPYGLAEAEYHRRHSQFRAALLAIGCRRNPSLVLIAELIFAETSGGLREYAASYDTLAEPPRGGCCERKTAIKCVAQLEDSGMLVVARSAVSGRNAMNRYGLDLSRIAELARSRGTARQVEDVSRLTAAVHVDAEPKQEIPAVRRAETSAPQEGSARGTTQSMPRTPQSVPGTAGSVERTTPGTRAPGPGCSSIQETPGNRETGTGGRGVLARRLPNSSVGLAVLRDTGELLQVFREVCQYDPIPGLAEDCEQDQHRWVAAAEHALRSARAPVLLFTSVVKRGLWSYITEAADESARRRLVAYDRELRQAECLL